MPAEKLAQIVGGWSTFAASLIGGCALVGAAGQISAARVISAKETYRGYLDKALDYPAFANPSIAAEPLSEEEFERYEWFVSYLLNSCDEILISMPRDEGWSAACADQISYHRDYLTSDGFEEMREHYSPRLQSLLPPSAADAGPNGMPQ